MGGGPVVHGPCSHQLKLQELADAVVDRPPPHDRLFDGLEVVVEDHDGWRRGAARVGGARRTAKQGGGQRALTRGLFRHFGAREAHRQPHVSGLERRRVVRAVASHADHLAGAMRRPPLLAVACGRGQPFRGARGERAELNRVVSRAQSSSSVISEAMICVCIHLITRVVRCSMCVLQHSNCGERWHEELEMRRWLWAAAAK